MLDAIGATLRAAREARGWTIDEVEKATHIRARYLLALETGNLDALPSLLQARGFLRNYAQHLGLEPNQVLSQLDEALKPAKRGFLSTFNLRSDGKKLAASNSTQKADPFASRSTRSAPASPAASIRRLRRVFTPDLMIAFIAIVVVVGFLGWGGYRLANSVFNPPPISATPEVLGPTETPTPTIIANITPSETPLPPGITFTNVQLTLIVEKRTFVRVLTDGATAFEGILLPEERRDFVAQQVAEVMTGDGASLRVIVNQRDLGLIGASGEVVIRQFVPTGVITVTPTITLTPSQTLTPSETPTSTLVPTETPILTPTRTPRP